MVLGLDEVEAFGGGGEPGEHEGKGWVLKEPLLCLLAILVHRVSHKCEVDSSSSCLTLLVVALFLLLDVGPSIFLVMSVRMNHGHDYVQELFLIFSTELGVYAGEILHGEALK
jgi:hypothetical protein